MLCKIEESNGSFKFFIVLYPNSYKRLEIVLLLKAFLFDLPI